MVYIILFLILLGMALNRLFEKYALYNVSYGREVSKHVVEIDESFELTSVLENAKFLPVTFLQASEKLPRQLKFLSKADIQESERHINHKITMLIMPYQRVRRTYDVSCSERGRYILREVELIAGDMLGLNVTRMDAESLQEFVVLPRALDLEKDLMPYGDYMGNISVKRWLIDDPVITIGINEYTGREPQKYINWPASLRMSNLMVNKFDYTADRNVMIILNIECIKPFWKGIDKEKIESCISAARSLMEQFETESSPYGFITNIQGFPYEDQRFQVDPGCGPAHFYSILEGLGGAGYAIGADFEKVLEIMAGRVNISTTYIIITPSILEPYIEHINALNRTASRTMVISLDKRNLHYLDQDIAVFTERGEKYE